MVSSFRSGNYESSDEVTLTLGAVVTSSHRVDKHLTKRILSVEFLGIPPCFQKGAVVET